MALHFIERYKMMIVKVQSKFELRRICKTVGATALVRLVKFLLSLFIFKNNNKQGTPIPEELGLCDVVTVEEIGSTKVTIFRQEKENSEISTIVVRASTENILNDIERSIG